MTQELRDFPLPATEKFEPQVIDSRIYKILLFFKKWIPILQIIPLVGFMLLTFVMAIQHLRDSGVHAVATLNLKTL